MRKSTLAAYLIALVAATPAFAGTKLESAQAMAAPASSNSTAAPEARALVDINHANRDTLKTLPGVGDSEADQIIAARPYKTKAELVTKKALPMGVFLNLKRSVTVQLKPARPTKAKAKKLKS